MREYFYIIYPGFEDDPTVKEFIYEYRISKKAYYFTRLVKADQNKNYTCGRWKRISGAAYESAYMELMNY